MTIKISERGIEGIDGLPITGDFSFKMRKSVPAGWVQAGTTIGAPGSGADRANTDTLNLFTLWWTDFTNAELPILTSAGGASTRGASAAADWAAGKRLTVFPVVDFVRGSSVTFPIGTTFQDQIKDHTHSLPVTGSAGGATARFSFINNDGAAVLNSGNPTSGSGTETRPKGIAMMACFKL